MKQHDVAITLLKGISEKTLSQKELEAAANYFAQGPTPLNRSSFYRLFNAVINHLDEHPAIRRLAREYKAQLAQGHFDNNNQAQQFIRRYVRALDTRLFHSTEITAGYARRGTNNAYDTVAGRASNTHGWMLIFTLEGQGVLDTSSRKHTMSHGDLLLFEPGATPFYYPARDTDCWGHYWLIFQETHHWKPWLEWPKISVHTCHVKADANKAAFIQQAFDTLINCSDQDSPVRHELEKNLTEQIILHGFELTASLDQLDVDKRIIRAQQYIEKHYNEAFTLDDIARHANLSAAGLARLFKQETGTSVLSWRDEKRMMTAIRLLENTKLPINEVASNVGFSDPNFFSTKFKSVFNASPKNYRQSLNR